MAFESQNLVLISLSLITTILIIAGNIGYQNSDPDFHISSVSINRSNIIRSLYRSVDLSEKYRIEWEVDFLNKTIEFTATVRTKGYIGFGISYTGGMAGSDVIIGGVLPNGKTYFSDRHAKGTFTPAVDASQDWILKSGHENSTHTILKFSRLLETCDENDITINDDTLKIIWSFGPSDNIRYHGHGHGRGSFAVNFLDPKVENPDVAPYKKWQIMKEQVLPSAETTYMCTFFQAPNLSKKHHIVGFDIHFNDSESWKHTHHADFYKCSAPKGVDASEYFSQYVGKTYDCYFSKEYLPIEHCQLFEFQWSIGAKTTMLPDDIGVPFGENPNEFYMTEIHYENPQHVEGLEVKSGLEFYYTENLRPIEAGFLFLGTMTSKLYSVTVPPKTDEFVLNSHCPSDCTANIPSEGLNVFIYLLHSHLSGRQIRLRQFRNGTELPWIANDEHYDFNYQNNRHLRQTVKILPGDHLTLECTYETNWKDGKIVTGGRSPQEEMCHTFLLYYPRTETINQCGSYFPQLEMLNYMGIDNVTTVKGEIDPTVIAPENLKGKKYSEVVESIEWTKEKRIEFQEKFRFSDHQSYCYPHHIEDDKGTPFVMTNYPDIKQGYHLPNSCAKK